MQPKKPIFRMTNHCRIRYYERVLNEPWNGFCKAEKELWQRFHTAEENLHWVNNTGTVEYFKEKLGHCKVKIFKNKELNLVFVLAPSSPFFVESAF